MSKAEDGLVADRAGIRKLSFVGLAGGLIGVGICRFAYTPLVPVMIGEGWITEAQAGYLGAINFAGYFAGAALAWPSAKWLGTGRSVHLNIALCFLSLAAAALPWGRSAEIRPGIRLSERLLIITSTLLSTDRVTA